MTTVTVEAKQELVPIKTNCFWWNHQWTRWMVHTIGELSQKSYPGDKVVLGHCETQRRECLNCGKSQLRMTQASRRKVE